MDVLIAGAQGQLGRELCDSAPAGFRVLPSTRADADITDSTAIQSKVREHRPELIINAAGYTSVDRAEGERENAYRVNATGAAHLADAALDVRARLIHVSTDYVFDGKSNRPYSRNEVAQPLGVYGSSKFEGERRVLAILGKKAVVVRTSWLYSVHGNNFVKSMLKRLDQQDEVRVVADQLGTPTWARGLADAIWRMAEQPGPSGIYHWTDAGTASWYDFAVAIQEEALALRLISRQARIVPIRTEEYPAVARRPAYSVLDKSDAARDFALVPEHWRVNLRKMLQGLTRA
jgi:dTDP-4-dehydrorhamnose reductase